MVRAGQGEGSEVQRGEEDALGGNRRGNSHSTERILPA